jgi:hypothetical protein
MRAAAAPTLQRRLDLHDSQALGEQGLDLSELGDLTGRVKTMPRRSAGGDDELTLIVVADLAVTESGEGADDAH